MSKKNLNDLKRQYESTPVPAELEERVKKAIKKGSYFVSKKVKWILGVAVLIIAFISGVNISPKMANALSEIPLIKDLVRVVTFREYKINAEHYNANIVVPSIDGLKNQSLAQSLNQKYLEENKALYEQFLQEVADLEALGSEGYLGLDTGYVVKTNNEQILSIGRYVTNIAGSASNKITYDTIDKQNEILITLPSLFKDESYIPIISENIRAQMIKQMEEDESIMYWVEEGEFVEPFKTIDKNQNFYINEDHKLVISFDEYEVAPGYMGVVEFVIPTEILSDILVSNQYIK